ncbi:ABC transporter substrate-binding protein [Clostridium paraputrificum]|uniref:ABC transporter substrate-binding protein n=1 Tax=Clostridium TaxID=1485 RepID=UPI003D330E74
MKGRTIILSLVIVSIFSLISCRKSSSTQNNENNINKGNKIVRLATATTNAVIGGVGGVAQEKKFIEDELSKIGYEVKYINFPAAGPAINEAFVSEEIEFADYGNLPPVVLKSKGVDISIIGVTDTNVVIDLLVQKDSNIKSVNDLKGKKVIVGKGTIYQQYFNNLIKRNGVEVKDIEVINSVAEAQSTFLSKSVDAYITSSIGAKLLEGQGNGKIIESSLNTPELSSETVLVGRNKYIKENPKVAVALLKAYIRAQEFARNNSNEAYKIFSNVGVDEGIIRDIYGVDNGKFENFTIEISQDTQKKIKNLSTFLKDEGLISKDINVDELIDNSYFEKAKKELEEK